MPDQAWSCPWPSHQACPWSCPCGWEACSRRPSGPEWAAVAAWLPRRGGADALAAWPGPKGRRPLDSLGGTSKHTTTATYLCTGSCTQARVPLSTTPPVLTTSQVGRRTGTTRRRACRSGNRRPPQIGVGIESARARGRIRVGGACTAASRERASAGGRPAAGRACPVRLYSVHISHTHTEGRVQQQFLAAGCPRVGARVYVASRV